MIFLAFVLLITVGAMGFIYWQVQKSIQSSVPPEVIEHLSQGIEYFDREHSPTVNDLADVLRANKFDDAAATVEGAWQHCYRLVAASEEEASARTRIGGLPDLPDVAMWPHFEGAPLAFLAQLDLAELAALHPESPLPKSGLLSFFYDSEGQPRGYNESDRDHWRILYFRDPFQPALLEDYPEGLAEESRHPAAPVFVENGESLPDVLIDTLLEGHGPLKCAMIENMFDQYQQFYEGAAHQILGFPYTIDGHPGRDCQLAAKGLPAGPETDEDDPRVAELEAGADQWRLLLQIDSDGRAGMMWGHMGTLYFMIREADLAAGHFEKAWVILQTAE